MTREDRREERDPRRSVFIDEASGRRAGLRLERLGSAAGEEE